MRLNRPVPCLACHGTGTEGGVAPKTCTACNGTGRVTRSTRKEKEHILFQQVSICSACHGRGSMIEHPCPECQGRGNVEQEESFMVTIPPGIEGGMALRIPGKGMASLEAGSASEICLWSCVRGEIHVLSEPGQICYGSIPFL